MSAEVQPFPFATLEELKERWPGFPTRAENHARTALEDASQFILDTVPESADAPERTRRRIVCAVVKRAMFADESDMAGVQSYQQGAGPYQSNIQLANPHGDFYLTRAERKALGGGKGRAYTVQLIGGNSDLSEHLPWCSLRMLAGYCSCGVDIAGEPIFER